MTAANDTNTAKIRCAKNGPYIVSDLAQLTGADGAPIEAEDPVALCRCGGSASKPFCDGTHTRNGFTSDKAADRTPDKRDTYIGRDITIHDNRGVCAHAGMCSDSLAAVWRVREEPWIDADGASADAIIAVIEQCPSGALSYATGGGAVTHRPPSDRPEIEMSKDGPYHVHGGVTLEGHAPGEGASGEYYTLCRCGASKNKPLCDGSHWQAGFKDPV